MRDERGYGSVCGCALECRERTRGADCQTEAPSRASDTGDDTTPRTETG